MPTRRIEHLSDTLHSTGGLNGRLSAYRLCDRFDLLQGAGAGVKLSDFRRHARLSADTINALEPRKERRMNAEGVRCSSMPAALSWSRPWRVQMVDQCSALLCSGALLGKPEHEVSSDSRIEQVLMTTDSRADHRPGYIM